MGDSRMGSDLSQLAGDVQARHGTRADHRQGATRASGISEIARPLAARDAYGLKPIARADGPVLTVDFEPEMAVAFGGRFDTFNQQLAFVSCVRGENQATAPEGKMRDIIHWSLLGWAGIAREVAESSVLSMGLVRFQVGGRCTPECGPGTCRLQGDSLRRRSVAVNWKKWSRLVRYGETGPPAYTGEPVRVVLVCGPSYRVTTFCAAGPFWPSTTSNSTLLQERIELGDRLG